MRGYHLDMQPQPNDPSGLIDTINTIIATCGFAAALYAIVQTKHSERIAKEANTLSLQSNDIARHANELSAAAVRLQEAEGQVRLVVKPRMLYLAIEGEHGDLRARPMVTVVNLSTFAVTVNSIFWSTNQPSGAGFFWKTPSVGGSSRSLPMKIEPRHSFTAIGEPDMFNLEQLLSITAAVAQTACGESVEGMTPQWTEYCAKAKEAGHVQWEREDPDGDQSPSDGPSPR